MIIKEIDKKPINNKFDKSGVEAEKQMAFYLKRAFEDNKDVLVLNDLRIEMDGDFAQIDHLIINEYGFIIIESKSVSAKVSVNEHEEWIRTYNRVEKGMPSPIKQAERQMDFLIKFLDLNGKQIMRDTPVSKIFGKNNYVNFENIIYVAISDTGIIERNNIVIPEVLKADSICKVIISKLKKYKRDELVNTINPFGKLTNKFHKDTIIKIANFLLESHSPKNSIKKDTKVRKPVKAKKEDPIVENKPEVSSEHTCSKCGKDNLEINYGKFGYYFKCLDCEGNTKIKLTCNKPSCKPKIRKSKKEFFKTCKDCDIDTLFFTNK